MGLPSESRRKTRLKLKDLGRNLSDPLCPSHFSPSLRSLLLPRQPASSSSASAPFLLRPHVVIGARLHTPPAASINAATWGLPDFSASLLGAPAQMKRGLRWSDGEDDDTSSSDDDSSTLDTDAEGNKGSSKSTRRDTTQFAKSKHSPAICFCNRAAAYRAMGQILDAIAACSLAIALDGNYYKAISRRAALYEMIRDYGQAVTDLQKLTSLLTKELDKKMHQSGASDKMDCMNELRQARFKLVEMEEADRNEIPLNLYLILGKQ